MTFKIGKLVIGIQWNKPNVKDEQIRKDALEFLKEKDLLDPIRDFYSMSLHYNTPAPVKGLGGRGTMIIKRGDHGRKDN